MKGLFADFTMYYLKRTSPWVIPLVVVQFFFFPGSIKAQDFKLPLQSKITEDDKGNELGKQDAGADSRKATGSNVPAGKTLRKVELQTNNFVPKSPSDLPGNILTPIYVEKPVGKEVRSPAQKAADQADSINMVPLPLISSPEETIAKLDEQREIEREQLVALWEATLGRSIDIKFVMQKLMPTTEKSKSTTVMMKMLSSLMYAGMGSLNIIAPGPTTRIGQSVGFSLLSNLLKFRDSKQDQIAHITQTEQIMLFQMVRKTADSLVDRYRNYKKEWKSHIGATQDLVDLKRMVADARVGQSAADQIKMEYYLRKQKRDINEEKAELELFRQALIDLAGPEAVLNLEKQFEEEFKDLYPEVID